MPKANNCFPARYNCGEDLDKVGLELDLDFDISDLDPAGPSGAYAGESH